MSTSCHTQGFRTNQPKVATTASKLLRNNNKINSSKETRTKRKMKQRQRLPTIELSPQQAIHQVDTTSFEILGPSTSFEEIASSSSSSSSYQGGGGDNSSNSFLVPNEDKILEVPIAAVELVGGGGGYPNEEMNDLNENDGIDNDPHHVSSSSPRPPSPIIVWAAPAPLDDDEDDEEQSRKRASLLSATIIRNSTDEKLGLGLHMTTAKGKPVLIISSIKPNGLLSDSPFRVGDRLVSINNVSCENMRKSEAAQFLRTVIGTLTVIVQNDNDDGDSRLVESMIRKPTPTSKTGLAVVSNGYSRAQVSNIRPNGLFERSLLSRKDLILSVNNIPCQNLDSKEVADIVMRAKDSVTIVAERKHESAVVVATTTRQRQ